MVWAIYSKGNEMVWAIHSTHTKQVLLLDFAGNLKNSPPM